MKRNGEVGRRLMHLVPAPAVRLMKRRVQSRPGVRQLETIPGHELSYVCPGVRNLLARKHFPVSCMSFIKIMMKMKRS